MVTPDFLCVHSQTRVLSSAPPAAHGDLPPEEVPHHALLLHPQELQPDAVPKVPTSRRPASLLR